MRAVLALIVLLAFAVAHATSSDAVPPRIAYLADGKVHLKLGDEPRCTAHHGPGRQ